MEDSAACRCTSCTLSGNQLALDVNPEDAASLVAAHALVVGREEKRRRFCCLGTAFGLVGIAVEAFDLGTATAEEAVAGTAAEAVADIAAKVVAFGPGIAVVEVVFDPGTICLGIMVDVIVEFKAGISTENLLLVVMDPL